MADLSQSGWLMPTLSTRTKAELIKIAALIPREYHVEIFHADAADARSKADLQCFIEECRRLYWDAIPRDQTGRTINTATRTAKRQATGRSVAADLCKISAAEVNDWLRSLPGRDG